MLTGEAASHFRAVDLGTLDSTARYKLLTGTVVPRPIALVSTLGPSGVVNLAPFSQFMIFAANPGMLGFSCSPVSGAPKHTVANVRASSEMVINICHAGMAEQVQTCSREIGPDESEAALSGLDLMPSELVAPPRVAVSPVQFECTLERMDEIGDLPNVIVVGRIRRMHLRADVLLPGGRIDIAALQPLARIAGRNYCTIGEIITA